MEAVCHVHMYLYIRVLWEWVEWEEESLKKYKNDKISTVLVDRVLDSSGEFR
jgi:hypothetical protein